MQKIIKILLATLLFLCLLQMPYGFYQLVRTIALIGFSILAFKAFEGGNSTKAIIYVGLAILFQPIIKIALGREIWNVVDIVVGIGLIISLLKTKDEN